VHAALDINPPNYASDILTANEVIESIACLVFYRNAPFDVI